MHDGEIILRWDAVKGRIAYLVQINDTPADQSGWRELTHTGKLSVVAKGLVTDHEYAFRMATLSSAGYSGWSEITKQKAL